MEIGEIEMPVNSRAIGFAQFDYFPPIFQATGIGKALRGS